MATCSKCNGRKILIVNLQVGESDARNVGFEADCNQCKGTGKPMWHLARPATTARR